MIVMKFGGTSVESATAIERVAAIVRARAARKPVVVVSAMGKTTNQLIEKAKSISASPSRRELDMLLTCGEREAMALLCMACAEQGLEAISFTGSQAGILTNDRHSGARIVEVRPFRVEDELDRGKVVIVAGFQGVSYKREITTLGRGGSDTTAVALAGALRADYCEICSDVDGVYTADPRIVPAAELLASISHDEMLELAPRWRRRDRLRFFDQLVRGLAHRRDHDHDLLTGGLGTRDPLRDELDLVRIGYRGAAVLLNHDSGKRHVLHHTRS